MVENKSTQKETSPSALCSLQIPHEQAWDRTWAYMVRGSD